MTEIKKPFPDNKHETRLSTESRPAGIAPSTYREGPSGSVDMIEVVAEKPRVVRISQGAYNGLVNDGTQFLREDHFITVFADPPVPPAIVGPWHVVGTIPVLAGMAFDLTDLRFTLIKPLNVVGLDVFDQMANWQTFGIYMYRVCVQGVLPWDAFTVTTVPAPARFGGMFELNTPWLSDAGDSPVHLVAREGQVMTFEVAQVVAADPTVVFEDGLILARPRGRWIPIQHYKRIVGANALE